MNPPKLVSLSGAVLALSLLSGCGGGSDGDLRPPTQDTYVRARLNGQLLEYRVAAGAVLDKTPTGHGRLMVGGAQQSAQSSFPSFSFQVADPIGLGLRTYREGSHELIFRHSLSGTVVYHSAIGAERDFEITVTEINDREVHGRFSGTLRDALTGTGVVAVTDGRFVVRRQRD